MVKRERVSNWLRAHGWRFKDQGKRVMLWAKGVDRLAVRRTNQLKDEEAAMILRRAGATETEVSQFVRTERS